MFLFLIHMLNDPIVSSCLFLKAHPQTTTITGHENYIPLHSKILCTYNSSNPLKGFQHLARGHNGALIVTQ